MIRARGAGASVLDAIEDASMCEIQRRQKTERRSLGVVRPLEVTDLQVTAAEEGFAESQRALLNQPSLFGDRAGDATRAALEPLPVKAKFSYRSSDSACRRSLDELIDELVGAGAERLVDVRELSLSRRRGFSKTALSEALRATGIEYLHVRALGNPKPNRDRNWAGDFEGGAAVYRKQLNNGSQWALLELAESLGAGQACLLCFERDHTECHRDVIVEALQELQPDLAVSHL